MTLLSPLATPSLHPWEPAGSTSSLHDTELAIQQLREKFNPHGDRSLDHQLTQLVLLSKERDQKLLRGGDDFLENNAKVKINGNPPAELISLANQIRLSLLEEIQNYHIGTERLAPLNGIPAERVLFSALQRHGLVPEWNSGSNLPGADIHLPSWMGKERFGFSCKGGTLTGKLDSRLLKWSSSRGTGAGDLEGILKFWNKTSPDAYAFFARPDKTNSDALIKAGEVTYTLVLMPSTMITFGSVADWTHKLSKDHNSIWETKTLADPVNRASIFGSMSNQLWMYMELDSPQMHSAEIELRAKVPTAI